MVFLGIGHKRVNPGNDFNEQRMLLVITMHTNGSVSKEQRLDLYLRCPALL